MRFSKNKQYFALLKTISEKSRQKIYHEKQGMDKNEYKRPLYEKHIMKSIVYIIIIIIIIMSRRQHGYP